MGLNFLMQIVRHAAEVRYTRCLLRLVRNSIEVFYIVKDADGWCRDMKFEGRQLHRLRRPRHVEWHTSVMFVPISTERIAFYTPVPNGRNHKSNCVLEVPTPLRFSYLAHYKPMSSSKIREHLG